MIDSNSFNFHAELNPHNSQLLQDSFSLNDDLTEFLNSDFTDYEYNNENKDYYFDSYANISIHEEMLLDKVRMRSYLSAISMNKHLFKDKIVLDVGAGTGILSLAAARAGAKHVYGIEYSNIADLAVRIVNDNNYQDKVTIIKETAEDAQLPVKEVDIIISEWMGYMLLYEGMLQTVLKCRDRWLKKQGGLIFPNNATIYCAAINLCYYRYNRLDCLNNINGFDFSAAKDLILKEAHIESVTSDNIITIPQTVVNFNLDTMKESDLDFACRLKLVMHERDFCHGLVFWFEISFPTHVPIVMSTSPDQRTTHWKQTVFYFNESIPIEAGDYMDLIFGLKRNKNNSRLLDFKIKYRINELIKTQFYYLH